MVQALATFNNICYLVRRDMISEAVLQKVDKLLTKYYELRQVFIDEGIRSDFNLPRQHSLKHYRFLVQEFGAPNGLCSSITESKHIKAVKQPYRRSSRNAPLGQMLVTNQRLDKLAAVRVNFEQRGMLGLDEKLTTKLRRRLAPPNSSILEAGDGMITGVNIATASASRISDLDEQDGLDPDSIDENLQGGGDVSFGPAGMYIYIYS